MTYDTVDILPIQNGPDLTNCARLDQFELDLCDGLGRTKLPLQKNHHQKQLTHKEQTTVLCLSH